MEDECKTSPKIPLKSKMQLLFFLDEHKVCYDCNIQLWDLLYIRSTNITGYYIF